MEKELPDLMKLLLLVAASFASGVLNGALGTGGGTVLIFTYLVLLPKEKAKDAYALSTLSVFLFSLISAFFYGGGGHVDRLSFPLLAIGAGIGSAAGALLLPRLPTSLLKKIMGALLLLAGCRMTGVF